MMLYYTRFNSDFCEIILVGNQDGLTNLHLNTGKGKREFKISENWILNNNFFSEISAQLQEFFKGNRKKFNLKLNPEGTEFQKKVWAELYKIPYGETRTYQEIAIAIGNEKASRAIGMANSKNPIPVIVPCHRVIGKNGKLTGFTNGLEIKEKLLDIEKQGGAISTEKF